MLKSVKTNSDDIDVGNTRSGVFRRIMARDLYDMTRRLDALEEHAQNPFSTFLTSWPHVVLVLLLLVILFGNILYFGSRIDGIEALQREETLAHYAELESKQRMIDELQQTIRKQADMLRAIDAEDGDAVPKSARPVTSRESLPAALMAGEVLLIVASTLTREDAIDQAVALEPDGYASEVILGKTGYYGVALGRFEFEQAKSMKSFMVEAGIVDTTPYLITDESIDSYVYP